MATQRYVSQFLKVLASDDSGATALYQLGRAVELDLVPHNALAAFLHHTTQLWLDNTGGAAASSPRDSGVTALYWLRRAAGHAHGFPAGRAVRSSSPVHFLAVDYDAITRFVLELDEPLTRTLALSESGSPADFNVAVRGALRTVQERAAGGQAVVRPGAWLANPDGVLWSTPSVLSEGPDPHAFGVADSVRDRLGLVDLDADTGKGLFAFTVSADWLGQVHRPTPVEGGNSRFRLTAHDPEAFNPFGATVHLKRLAENAHGGALRSDDGERECVSVPLQPDADQWAQLLRDLQFLGPLSPEGDQPQCTDAYFRGRVIASPEEGARMFAQVQAWCARPGASAA